MFFYSLAALGVALLATWYYLEWKSSREYWKNRKEEDDAVWIHR